MVDDATFLAAILAAPDDDGPRLVYADWLEEHGDTERSEFIRVQIELAHTPVEEGRAGILRRREAELLRQHRDDWLKPLTDRLAAERGAELPWPQPVEAIQSLFEMFSPSVPIGQPPDEPPFPIRAATERLMSEFERSPLQLLLGPRSPMQFEFRLGFVQIAT